MSRTAHTRPHRFKREVRCRRSIWVDGAIRSWSLPIRAKKLARFIADVLRSELRRMRRGSR